MITAKRLRSIIIAADGDYDAAAETLNKALNKDETWCFNGACDIANTVKEAHELLLSYMIEFPEHDQCDLRIWEADQKLQEAML